MLDSLPDTLAIYLFGSCASGQARDDSDVDLAVLTVTPVSPQLRWDTAQTLAKLLARDVDLVVLREASTVMRLQVVAHGERLYCRDHAAAGLFETTTFSASPA